MMADKKSKMTMSILGKLRDSGMPEAPSVQVMSWDEEEEIGPDGKPIRKKKLAAKPRRPKDEFDEGGGEGPEGY